MQGCHGSSQEEKLPQAQLHLNIEPDRVTNKQGQDRCVAGNHSTRLRERRLKTNYCSHVDMHITQGVQLDMHVPHLGIIARAYRLALFLHLCLPQQHPELYKSAPAATMYSHAPVL